MLTHVVLFKLLERSPQNVADAVARIKGLDGKIPGLKSLSAGADIIHSERSYDLALIATFDSLEDMQAYQVHPEHVKVSEYLSAIRESSITVDYHN